MKVRFDYGVDGWLITEVEGNSLEDCKNKLLTMSLQELIDEGYVKDFTIINLDSEILETTYKIKVTSVDYDIDEEDLPAAMTKEELISTLPQTMELEITATPRDDLDELVVDEVSYQTDWLINGCTYEIISEN